MSEKDGGPALIGFRLSGNVAELTSQLSLRDYFAAAAFETSYELQMNAAKIRGGLPDEFSNIVARSAYAFADAMLKERAK